MSNTTDPNAILATLYRENHRWLRGWLNRQLQCPQDAADLTQDTFLRALYSRQLEEIQEPRAFLGTLARRLLCNFWRRRQLERSYLEALVLLPDNCVPSEEDIALVREAIEAIDQLLDGLPRRARRAFLLNRLDGLTQPEIAARLGISLATVERDLRRAYLHCLTYPEQP
ncbi:sigma-70 family RNA polymerase sigma factor [Azomonas macrocytogenes]|uniref:RNA polymerase sigma-70 factor (ECF subfamily) n=1 Tax=Azomonas macrocytogenes TaxID=69962 RepID=A0A839T570_AZOMA|nr:RNA polymerase sigma-70 factor (ECF subfamily) [Azomonas macrocytogenes]